MATVVLSSYKVSSFPEGGGHFWVYMQYAQALRRLGCDVYWLEHYQSKGDAERDASAISTFLERLERYGLGNKFILYITRGAEGSGGVLDETVGMTPEEADAVVRRADLLLNFHYVMDPTLLARFRRTALVDIDPGLLQFWISRGQLCVPQHDYYFTTGETVGTPAARFPDCGLPWIHIRPAVCLELWPYVPDPGCQAFTTVSSWWGGGT